MAARSVAWRDGMPRPGARSSGGARVAEEFSGYAQHRLERTKTPIVVLLRRQELLAEGEERDEFATQDPGVPKSLREENHLSDELKVWHRHGDRSEELLEVVGKLTSPAVPFTRWV